MVKFIQIVFYLIICGILINCTPVPIRRLKYLGEANFNDLPLVHGCYYFIEPLIIDGEHYDDYIDFKVFFGNGLIKYASISIDDNMTIESQVRSALTQYKNQPSVWGTYIIKNDTLITHQIKSTGMAPHALVTTHSLILNDTTFIEFKTFNDVAKEIQIVNNVYKYTEFKQPPDSTGFLYDKLKKKQKRKN